jgi:hypothetical protein
LVFRRGLYLIACQFKDDPVVLFVRRKMQRIPIDRDLPAADTKKPAEIDNGGPHTSVLIDNHIDDAAHVLIRGAKYRSAKNSRSLPVIENGGGRGRR